MFRKTPHNFESTCLMQSTELEISTSTFMKSHNLNFLQQAAKMELFTLWQFDLWIHSFSLYSCLYFGLLIQFRPQLCNCQIVISKGKSAERTSRNLQIKNYRCAAKQRILFLSVYPTDNQDSQREKCTIVVRLSRNVVNWLFGDWLLSDCW